MTPGRRSTGREPVDRPGRPEAERSPSAHPEGVLPEGVLPAAAEKQESAARPPDPDQLEARIRDEIRLSADGRITFRRFMEMALYEPGLGYYRRPEDRPTDTGDFLTAPETHPIFGWTIARRIEAQWDRLGRPDQFDVVEYGAGSGTLGLAILDGLRRRGSMAFDASRYEPIETNPHRIETLRRRFEEAGLGAKLAELPVRERADRPPATGVVLANEFLDALPVHRVLMRGGRLRELCVAWRDGRFVLVVAEPTTPALAERLAADGVSLVEEQAAEICLGIEPWLDEVAARLSRGLVIVIDYGWEAAELYGRHHMAGTLLGYRSHRVVDDPLAFVGRTDLTAHVDFGAVARLAGERGFSAARLTTQSRFLVDAGLENELRALQADPATRVEDYLRARSGIVRMIDPRRMGGFRVLELERGSS